MEVLMPFDDGFSRYKNPYFTSGFAQVCREYIADPQGMYKFRAVGASLTNGEWWQQGNEDYAEFTVLTSQGLTTQA